MNIKSVFDNGIHGSSAQKSIWHSIRMLAGFEAVEVKSRLAGAGAILRGEESFYRFMTELYNDMYENPSTYYIPSASYDDYMKNEAKAVIGREKEHYTDTKECKLRNTFQQAIQFYPEFMYKLGVSADKVTDRELIILKSKYESIKESFKRSHVYSENNNRIGALNAFGIEIADEGVNYRIVSIKYPEMFLGLWVLCSAPEGKYKYLNYLRLNYKGFYKPSPEIKDILPTIKPEYIKAAEIICSCVAESSQKVKLDVKPLKNITSSNEWKVAYVKGGKNVAGFYAGPERLMLCVYFGSTDNIMEAAAEMEAHDKELFDWFKYRLPERLCKCRYNRAVTLGGVKRRVCGMTNRAEIESPDNNDVEKCVKLLKEYIL